MVMQNNSNSKDKLLTMKDGFIKDHFYHKGNKIAILENKAFKNVDSNLLILAKMNESENEILIEPLTDAEYEQAIRKYEALIKLQDEEEDDNE